MNTIVSASILSADICRLGEELDRIKASGCDHVHFDVMDGVFVPNISFGVPVLADVRRHTDMFVDVHLMITDPLKYVGVFADNGADMISFHLESESDPAEVIREIKTRGKKAGIAIKPGTPRKRCPSLCKLCGYGACDDRRTRLRRTGLYARDAWQDT